VENVQKPPVKTSKISRSPVNKKEAASPAVPEHVKSRSEKHNVGLTYMKKTIGVSVDDKTVIKELNVENNELNTKGKEVELSQSSIQARLTELGTKSSTVGTAETPEDAVAAEAAPPMEVTSGASKEPAAPTPTAAEEKLAEEKSEEAKEEVADEPMKIEAKDATPAVKGTE
jgi:peptidoglycan hydrolase CwlO-like protein